jgi:hypothetical protein
MIFASFTRRPLLSTLAVLGMTLSGWATSLGAAEQEGFVVEDPHYGDVLFHFYQEDDFQALTRLMAYREQGKVDRHEPDAEILQGGLLLTWGQHEEAGAIFERLLAENTDQDIRDRTWFYLGKVRYQRGYFAEAERAFTNIKGELPEALEAERFNLLARLYIDQSKFAAAVELLSGWEGPEIWTAYARYNMGVALVRLGQLEAGAQLLDQVGIMAADTEELKGLRDRANVALGFAYLQAELDGAAKPVLQRVRLNGPFSNKALLGAGWADSANANYQQALAPWLALSERDYLDSAVQESLLAVPFAFAKLNAQAQAAEYYARALDIFSSEATRLDLAIQEAGDGLLIQSLLANDDSDVDGWYWQLQSLPEDDRARYLYFAIADHEFHEGLKSYRDMQALAGHLAQWREKLSAYRDMLDTRRVAYEEKLPQMQARMAEFDRAALESRYAELVQQTEAARAGGDSVAIADADQQGQWARLSALEENPAFATEAAAQARDKQRILKGLLLWNMQKEYRVRLWRQQKQLNELAVELEQSRLAYDSLGDAADSIPAVVKDFTQRIDRLEPRLQSLEVQLQASLQRHSQHLTALAIERMQDQKQRLMTYRAQARYALASIYDRLSARTGEVAQ